MDPGKALDVLHLIQQSPAQDCADPGHGLEHVQGLGIVRFRCCEDVSRHITEALVIVPDQGEVSFQTFLHGRIRKPLGDARAVGFVGELFPALRGCVALGTSFWPKGWSSSRA